jgi:hypothetical protein
MAKQITQLPVAASVAASDVFPLDQSGTTKQATLTAIAAGLPTGTGTGGLVRQTNPVFSGITVGNVRGVADNSAYSVTGGNSDPGVATSGAWMSLYGGTNAINPGALVFGRGTGAVGIITTAGWGIGTTNVQAPLTVGGDIWINQTGGLYFTDANGTSPYLVSQGDNNFIFYGTGSAGAPRPIWGCEMRSDTAPLQIGVPLRLGGGASISTVLITNLITYAPAAIAANGGVQFTDVTITGVDGMCVTLVECSGGMSNNSIILKSNVVGTNTIRIYWINPTAASVTLSAANYKIGAIKFA